MAIQTLTSAGAVDALKAPVVVIDDFLPREVAQGMRADIETHFSNPGQHRPESHQVWNYWFVPGLYTYMRTQPEKVIRRDLVGQFHGALRRWSSDVLGLAMVTHPYLSLYVDGCSQGLHNDSTNGRFAYVYSLTAQERRTNGGETIVLHEGDPFRRNLRRGNAGRGLYDLIEPRFNRLVVFDDRLVHGVERVSGSMDPVQGRFVMHGHIEEAGPIVAGALSREAVDDGLRRALARFGAGGLGLTQRYHGLMTIRFAVSPLGDVTNLQVAVDRVFNERESDAEWPQIRGKLLEALQGTAFQPASGETSVTAPLTFGGPMRAPA
ncbi:MAG: 2OG-Fe(II) oxygenase [Rhodospirillaceae bacterium]|nr:2OG-Fe(II) oxygenase [Rhodospirillaceae bacterium]